MTETTDTSVETPTEAPEQSEAPENGNREAAKYRRQLRDVQQQLEANQTHLDKARSRILKGALDGFKVGGKTFNTEALKDSGIDTAALFDEDGELNTEALETTMTALAQEKPYMFSPPVPVMVPGAPESIVLSKPGGFTVAFKPAY